MKTPKLVKDWDIVDIIYFHDAIALWCGVNPQDHEARKDHHQEMAQAKELFLEGIYDGLLNFPSSDDPVSSDDHFHITRDDLKSFAIAIRKRPLFLFPRKGKKKTYNIPPKPYTSKTQWPKWEFLKRKEKLYLGQIFEMLFGVNPDFPFTIDRLGFLGPESGKETEGQVLELFLEGINTGYFGDILETYGNYKWGAFCDSEKTYTPLSAVPLPSNKVIDFLKKKNLLGLLRSCNLPIAEELSSILTFTPASWKASSKPLPKGRKPSPKKKLVQTEALRIRDEKQIDSRTKIANMPCITQLLKHDALHQGIESLSNEEYKKRYLVPRTRVAKWIGEAFKASKLT